MGLSKSQINALITYVDNEIPPRVRRILQSFGTNAHLYLPGVGVVDGLTAGNYQDSAGTTAGAVDSVVGLALDGAGSVGSELCPLYAQSVTSNTFGSNVSGAATGKTYKISATVTKTSGTGSVDVGITNSSYGWHTNGTAYTSANGTFGVSFIVKSTDSTVSPTVIFTNVVGSVTNFSVREITGTHATQSTTANKPLLKSSGGKYYWQFDGSNDLVATNSGYDFGQNGTLIVASKPTSLAYQAPVGSLSSANATGYNGAAIKLRNNGDVWFRTGNGDGNAAHVDTAQASSAYAAGETLVLSMKWAFGSNIVGRKNGANIASAGALAYDPSGSSMGIAIGAQSTGVTEPFAGNIYCLIAIKGTVSDADIAVLEKWAGRLAGVTI